VAAIHLTKGGSPLQAKAAEFSLLRPLWGRCCHILRKTREQPTRPWALQDYYTVGRLPESADSRKRSTHQSIRTGLAEYPQRRIHLPGRKRITDSGLRDGHTATGNCPEKPRMRSTRSNQTLAHTVHSGVVRITTKRAVLARGLSY